MKRRGLLALVTGALVVVLLRAEPSPIDAASYRAAPPPELAGALAPDEALRAAESLGAGRVEGPEDVAVDAEGRIYAGLADGRIVRLTAESGSERLEVFANTRGRPLGLDWSPAGELIVADARRGLLSVDAAGRVSVLATEAAGVPFGFTDDVDVASDGSIYFSDASSRFGVDEYLYDLLEARPWGRLLVYDPSTRQTRVLLDGLYFANGVALSRDEDFLVVNETYRYRIRRYWLEGERAGTSSVLATLPGFPDGVSSNGRGTFWVALFTVRNPALDRLHPHPWLKNQLARLPRLLWPKPAPYGLVVALDERGEVTRSLHDPGGRHVKEVTSAEEHGGHLYLGTLNGDRISRLALGPPPPR